MLVNSQENTGIIFPQLHYILLCRNNTRVYEAGINNGKKDENNIKWQINRRLLNEYYSCEGKALETSMEMAGIALDAIQDAIY